MKSGSRRTAWLAAVATASGSLTGSPVGANNDIVDLAGFVEPEMRLALSPDEAYWYNSARPDARAELRIYPSDAVDALVAVEGDIRFNRFSTPPIRADLRELWLKAYKDDLMFAGGRQIFSWGSIGEFGIVDILNPQQLVDTGQDLPDRKIGVWSMAMELETDIAVFQSVVIPFYQHASIPVGNPYVPDLLPSPVSSIAMTIGAPGQRSLLADEKPGPDVRNTQVAARAYFSLDRGDVGVGLAYLLDQVGSVDTIAGPGSTVTGLEIDYPRIFAIAGEGSVPLLEGFSLGLEGLVLIGDDLDGDNPLARNITFQSAARVRGFLSPQWQFEVGYLDQEVLMARSPGERDAEQRLTGQIGSPYLMIDPHLAHVLLSYRFGDVMHRVSVNYMTALTRSGHYLAPAAELHLADGIRMRTGAQIYAGVDSRGLGTLDEYSNLYVSLRADF